MVFMVISLQINDLVMTRTPAGRWGEPEDIAKAALSLASKASDFVNSHILFVPSSLSLSSPDSPDDHRNMALHTDPQL
jgi:hypothetical protein